MKSEPALHPLLEGLSFLLGTWSGEGKGFYPSIEPFGYSEEATFWHTGRPLLVYLQLTRSLTDGAPMHSETGYWRPANDGRIEIVIAHAFGVTEMGTGRLDGHRVEMTSRAIASTPTAKQIDEITRRVMVNGDELSYEVDMAAVGHPLQPHLTAHLKRA